MSNDDDSDTEITAEESINKEQGACSCSNQELGTDGPEECSQANISQVENTTFLYSIFNLLVALIVYSKVNSIVNNLHNLFSKLSNIESNLIS